MTRRLVGTAHCWAFPRLVAAGACIVTAAGCAIGGGDDTAPPPTAAASDAAADARAADASVDSPSAAKGADATVDAASDATGSDAGPTATDAGGSAAPAGEGGSPALDFEVSSGAIDFGAVNCGVTQNKTLSITNMGTAVLAVSVKAAGSGFSVAPSTLSLPPGSAGSLVVSVAVPTSAAVGQAGMAGSLDIFTNDPKNANLSVPLTATPTGATIALADQNGQPLAGISFPSTRVNTQAKPIPFQLLNHGNAPAAVTVSAPSAPFALDGVSASASLTLGANAGWMATAEFVPTDAGTPKSSSIITISGATCGTSQSTIQFTGTGSFYQLTGFPTKIDFGAAPCGGSAPSPQTFTLTNSGPVVANVTGVAFVPSGGAGFGTTIQSGDSITPNGGTLTVTVSAPAVPTPHAVSPPISAALIITTDADMTPGGTSIALQEEPTGAILSFDHTAVTTGLPTDSSFGTFGSVALLGTPQTQKFGLLNSGNAPATVSVVASTSSSAAPSTDAGSSDGATDAEAVAAGAPPQPFAVQLTTVTVAPAQQPEATDTVTFSPVVAGGNTGSLTMLVAVPNLDAGADAGTQTNLCAPLPSSLSLAGTGIGGGPSFSSTSLVFNADCSSSPSTAPAYQAITLLNDGTVPFNMWMAGAVTGPGAAQYTVKTVAPSGAMLPSNPSLMTPLLLQPSDQALIQVYPNALPPNVTSPTALNAQFTVETDVPYDSPHTISLQEIPIGDQFVFSPASLGFGYVPLAATMTPTLAQTFTLTNYANPGTAQESFTLSVQGTGDSAYTPQSWPGLSLASGQSLSESVAFAPTPPSSPALQQAMVTIGNTTNPQCTPLPSLPLIGTATSGVVSLSTNSLNFGAVNCGSAGTSQSFTVANMGGNQPFNITAAPIFTSTMMAAGTYFTASVTTSGGTAVTYPAAVIPGDYVTVTVTPQAIPSAVANPPDTSAFSDTITVTTDVPGDTPHGVTLGMEASGAIISPTALPTTWNFGTIQYGSIGTWPTTITNTGNAPAYVTFTSAVLDGGLPDSGLSQPTIFSLASNATTAAPNSVTSIVGQFTPSLADGTWSDQGTLSVTAAAFCEPLPSQWQNPLITLLGSSNGNPPVTIAGNLDFGTTECGSAPPGTKFLTLTNNTDQTYALTLSLSSNQYYTISAGADSSSGELPALGTTVIGVRPTPVVPGPGVVTGGAQYADNLSIVVGPTSQPVITFTQPISWALSGAVLSLPNGNGPYEADSTGGHTLAISNTGSEAATVQFQSGDALMSIAPVLVPQTVGAAPVLIAGTSAPMCPTTANSTLSFTYSGSVCQFLPSSVTVNSCVGTQ